MRRRSLALVVAVLLTASCATPAAREPGLPGSLIRSDDRTISGVWRGADGFVATIDRTIGTFVAKKGCTMSGGVLTPLGGRRYRIDRYGNDTHSTEECGPWRNGPAIAPFDGNDVALVRTADRLVASGGGRSVTLRRVRR